jgi:MFS family permease
MKITIGGGNGGIGFLGLLTILFIGLKLTQYIDWSWWWVFSPVWIPASIGIVIVVGLVLLHFILDCLLALKKAWKAKQMKWFGLKDD